MDLMFTIIDVDNNTVKVQGGGFEVDRNNQPQVYIQNASTHRVRVLVTGPDAASLFVNGKTQFIANLQRTPRQPISASAALGVDTLSAEAADTNPNPQDDAPSSEGPPPASTQFAIKTGPNGCINVGDGRF